MKWDEADLEARLCRALDLAKRALELFAADGYADAEVPENSFRPEKPIAETAMLMYAASGARRFPGVAGRIEETARILLPHARSRQTLLNITLHPALALDFAVPHVLLTRLGYPDEEFDRVLRCSLSSHTRFGHERPPFGSLEQKWIVGLWNGEVHERDWRVDLLNSVLHQPMDILGGLREDAYAFTHLMMYCTDFGFRSGRFSRARRSILAEARSLLAKCLDEENYDLAGEVLMTWPMMGARWCASSTFAFRVLARVEDRVGVLPVGTTRIDRLKKLEGKERSQYALGTAYHTAYVMGLLCAVSLLPGRAPSIKISGPRIKKPLLDRLLSFIDRDQGHWQSELAELSESEQTALAPLILDLAIAQKYRKHDYAAVGQLLAEGYEFKIATSPICGQAAELLERLAVCSEVIQKQSELCAKAV